MRREKMQSLAVPVVDISKLGVADADGVLQHRCKHRLKVAGGAADDLQHLRCRSLLLQRFGELPRALLLRLEQPHVLDGDDRLIGEGRHQLDLLFGKWIHLIAGEPEHADRRSAAQERHG